MKRPRNIARKALLCLLIVVVVAGFGGTGFYYYKYKKVTKDYTKLKNTPISELVKQAGDDEQKRLVQEIGDRYDLPKNETPIIAEVQDKNSLKDPFYKNAENGDKVLFYKNAKQAFLYRPSTKKLINVSALNVTASKAAVNIIGKVVDVAVVEKALNEKFATDVQINSKADAKGTYASVIVVDLTGKNGDLAAKIAAGLKGVVGDLPAGEDKPANTDLLVIAAPIP